MLLIEWAGVVGPLYLAVFELAGVNFEVVFTALHIAIVLVALIDVVFLLRALHHGLGLLGQLMRQDFAALL